VTVMVIDDSIIRSGLKVARALGLGGLKPRGEAAGPTREIDPSVSADRDWSTLTGDGAVRRLSLDVGQINAVYDASGDARAIARPEGGDVSETFIDMQTALVSVPAIGKSLLGDNEYDNLTAWLETGEQAILIAGRGRYSFKGSGYVRGGIFDRIQLIQGDRSVRFRDKGHRRLGALAAAGAPSFTELDLFKIPADIGFESTEPWRLQLLVNRPVSALEKSFQTFDLTYLLPDTYTRSLAIPQPAAAGEQATEAAQKQALTERIWRANALKVAILIAMLGILTIVFFAQKFLTASERATFWFRIVYLTVTLFFLGWYANAQLSVVNLMALAHAITNDFTWDAFLLDPLVFILWSSVGAALIFWGRGAYCGWLCPFGALQELTNRIAKLARIPQLKVPWALHERLWPIKYILFLGLFGISLASLPLAEQYAEIEPFKTAIILNFQRSWPFVVFALGILGIGLFVERFYCRYLCPLGAALAIPGRMRMFDWLKRYKECGSPCQTCSNECMVQAIHPLGEINPNECLYCLHCQVRYQDAKVCPVCIKTSQRRARLQTASDAMEASIAANPGRHS
ncbi:MAG: 4Fe-4S binding protein, partial [Alphaproteobacteria bacterium]